MAERTQIKIAGGASFTFPADQVTDSESDPLYLALGTGGTFTDSTGRTVNSMHVKIKKEIITETIDL